MICFMSCIVAVAYCASASAAVEESVLRFQDSSEPLLLLTEWHIVIALNRNILLNFDVVHTFKDCESVAYTRDSHLL
jgi:hypothetical protein